MQHSGLYDLSQLRGNDVPSPGNLYSLVPGLMSDMSIRGPVFWMRAWWWTDTPVQKLWGFPVWLNSVSVTGMVALSSPVGGKVCKSSDHLRSNMSKIKDCDQTTSLCVTYSSSSHRFAWCLLCPRSAAALSGCRCAAVGPVEAPSRGCQSCGCFC